MERRRLDQLKEQALVVIALGAATLLLALCALAAQTT
jgi:hypothetical protein